MAGMMKISKHGFTVIEMIAGLALTIVVISLIYSLFFNVSASNIKEKNYQNITSLSRRLITGLRKDLRNSSDIQFNGSTLSMKLKKFISSEKIIEESVNYELQKNQVIRIQNEDKIRYNYNAYLEDDEQVIISFTDITEQNITFKLELLDKNNKSKIAVEEKMKINRK